MGRAYFSSRISNFLTQDVDYILGQLLIQDEFQTTDLQKNAWKFEIALLQEKLLPFSDGDIAFEYTIPRLGHRIDVVCIIKGVIFVLFGVAVCARYRLLAHCFGIDGSVAPSDKQLMPPSHFVSGSKHLDEDDD